tara:strand:- start:392 stop:547 length:156 start_codon:yes stop_codon:yes gene_type:complete
LRTSRLRSGRWLVVVAAAVVPAAADVVVVEVLSDHRKGSAALLKTLVGNLR